MRVWHKDLIPYLPRQQLLGQWRELCCIAKNIYANGTPNHLLVNKVIKYVDMEFTQYARQVYLTMLYRGYTPNWDNFMKYRETPYVELPMSDIFVDWHNDRYFWQCYYNLQEKYDCGGLTDEEWGVIVDSVSREGR